MADEAISAASATMPMRSMHYSVNSAVTIGCLVRNSMALSVNRCMRAEENVLCLFSSYYLFPECVEEEKVKK